jgi:hypothetical protein
LQKSSLKYLYNGIDLYAFLCIDFEGTRQQNMIKSDVGELLQEF